jgi:hypothetical protein
VRPFSNISIHSSTILWENFIPILSTHAELNLCSRHTFCPQKAYDWSLFLFGVIYKFRSNLHHSMTTLVLTARSAGLPNWLVTWHSQTWPITAPPALTISREKIKVWKLFEDPSYFTTTLI